MGLYDEFCFQELEKQAGNAKGLALGIVKDNYDKKHLGMIKVNYTLGEDGHTESDWMRVVSSYAGKSFGKYFLPEVGTEVLVGFIGELFDNPVVLGCLYNGEDMQPDGAVTEKNEKKVIRTKGGHELIFSEEKKKGMFTITTPDKLKVQLQDEKKTILITDDSGKNIITLDGENGNISLNADKKIEIKIGSTVLKLDGNGQSIECETGKITLNAKQVLSLKGQKIEISGSMIELKADGSLKVSSSGITEVKGSMVKIN